MAVASRGDIIVAGSSEKESAEIDYLITKLSPAGETRWTTRYTSEASKTNVFSDMAIDEAGQIFITGSSDTVALSPFGELLWSAPVSGSAVRVNSQFVYVTGSGESLSATAQLGNRFPPPVDIIFDTDPDQDPDDMSDLTILHNLQTRGEINILGIIGSNPGSYVGQLIQIMNGFYGRTNIPVGLPTNGTRFSSVYGWRVTDVYRELLGKPSDIGEATATYRKILASRPDNSVTVVFVGQMRNLLNLWNSGPDEFSELSGPALLEKKIKRLVIVAGVFPTSADSYEYNFNTDIPAALVLNNITNSIPISFVGIEQGTPLVLPTRGVAALGDHPAALSHTIAGFTNRPSWGGLGLLFTVHGIAWRDTTFFAPFPGWVGIRSNGGNYFVNDPAGSHEFLYRTLPDPIYIRMIEDLLLYPRSQPEPPVDQRGRQLWMSSDSLSSSEKTGFVRLNRFGEILVAGVESSASADDSPSHFSLHKYGEAGLLHWNARSSGLSEPARKSTQLRGMAAHSGSVWLFGQYGSAGALFKLTDDGSQAWNYAFPGEATAGSMLVDSAGFAYLTHTRPDAVIITKVNPSGAAIDEEVHPVDGAGQIRAATFDKQGNIYLAGGGSDLFFLKFDPALNRLAAAAYAPQNPGEAVATAIAVNDAGDVYLAGHVPASESSSEFITIKFTSTLKAERLLNGAIRLRYQAPNQSLALEASNNLFDWQSIATNRADVSGLIEFQDGDAVGLPTRFYRLRQP